MTDATTDGDASSRSRTGGAGRLARWTGLVLLLGLAVHAGWCAVGRATVDGRRLVVGHTTTAFTTGAAGAGDRRRRVARDLPELTLAAPPDSVPASDSAHVVRVLAWNIAHGRGDVAAWPKNWRGGGDQARAARMDSIAGLIRAVDADLVILNEADFDAGWSDGVNHAATLARAAGYPTWVEQRNYDVRFPFVRYTFGNAVLSRLPVRDARWVALPPEMWLEPLVAGAKAASVVQVQTANGTLAVVPIHLEVRSEETRLAAVPVLARIRDGEKAPLVLGGDFNTGPPRWPGTADTTAVGRLLDRGFLSHRTGSPPRPDQLTFPSYDPAVAIDWVLVEPPLRVLDARVLHEAGGLSDHLPVVARVAVPVLDHR